MRVAQRTLSDFMRDRLMTEVMVGQSEDAVCKVHGADIAGTFRVISKSARHFECSRIIAAAAA